MVVYKATNTVNNKVYIGKTIRNINHAKARHKNRAFRDNYITYFYNALRKYGWEAFSWQVVFNGSSDEEIQAKEIELIAEHQDICYNMTSGGDGSAGIKVSEETRKKHSENSKGPNNNCFGLLGKDHPTYGNKHSDEFKQRMSERMSGRVLSDQTKDKLSQAKKTYTEEQARSITKLRDEDELTFKEIAERLGFKNPSTIYRIYKRHK